ncbi:MAG: hypothetical protein IPJ65_28610 [Archangiaceae bacterium]|nr:hypothetical protein [Archangiaceae bacterium]
MKRLLAVVVLVATGCVGGKPCQSNADCPDGYCEVSLGLCVIGDGGTAGGGTSGAGGGAGGQGGGAGGATALTKIRFEAPDAGLRTTATTLMLRARTEPVNADLTALQYAATSADGGAAPRTGTFTRMNADTWDLSLAGLVDSQWKVVAYSGAVDASVGFTVDLTGPALTVAVASPTPDYGTNVTDFVPSDDGGFRKDETIQVRVTSPDLDLSAVQLSARYGSATALALSTSTNCGDGGVACREFSVDLSKVEMPAFRGDVVLSASGMDDLGNAQRASTSATARVTRWQWARRVGVAAIKATPAIGNGGRLFVGLSSMTDSGVIAVNPDGGVAWPGVADEPVVGVIAVGRGASGEYVFYQSATATSKGTMKTLLASSGADGPLLCPGGGAGTTNGNEGGVALFAENTAAVASIAIQADTTDSRARVLVAEPQNCAPTTTLQSILAPGNVVASGSTAALIGSDGNLRVLDFNGTSVALRAINQSVGGVGLGTGLAMLSSTRVVGGGPGNGRIFALDISGTTMAPDAWDAGVTLSTPTSSPVVGQSDVFSLIRSSSGKVRLIRLASANGAELARTSELAASTFPSTSAPSPVLGSNSKLYAVDPAGSLFVVPTAFAPDAGADWSAPLPTAVAGTVTASPTLDCNRRRPSSQTAVLYLATESGWLVSYLVDATPGQALDPSAPWPKYARDSRNTGNFNGPAIGCPP